MCWLSFCFGSGYGGWSCSHFLVSTLAGLTTNSHSGDIRHDGHQEEKRIGTQSAQIHKASTQNIVASPNGTLDGPYLGTSDAWVV